MFRLDNKTAIITGGGSGIGRAIATVFAQQGATVHIFDMDEQGATNVVKEITTAGGKAQFHKCDVSKQTEVKQLQAAVLSTSWLTMPVLPILARLIPPPKPTSTGL
jgi:NAD(P)-dependent dehydrogenase (short-subunit alcohol dehydrogenase family)